MPRYNAIYIVALIFLSIIGKSQSSSARENIGYQTLYTESNSSINNITQKLDQKSNIYRARCKDKDEHEYCDLEAQWQSNIIGEENLSWVKFGIILSTTGTGILIWTLHLTRESLRTTQETAKHQLRAYVNVPSAVVSKEEKRIIIRIMNSGITPAIDVKFRYYIYPYYQEFKNVGISNLGFIESGGDRHIDFASSISHEIIKRRLINKRNAPKIKIVGEIYYLDCFGEKWKHDFQLQWKQSKHRLDDFNFRHTQTGNTEVKL